LPAVSVVSAAGLSFEKKMEKKFVFNPFPQARRLAPLARGLGLKLLLRRLYGFH
jgi:hypothetical protein